LLSAVTDGRNVHRIFAWYAAKSSVFAAAQAMKPPTFKGGKTVSDIDTTSNGDVPDPDEIVVHQRKYPWRAIPEWIIHHPALTDAEVRLWCRLRCFAQERGTAWPSRRTLAEMSGSKIETVDARLKNLEKVGALKIQRRRVENRRNMTNLYVLFEEPLEEPTFPATIAAVSASLRAKREQERRKAAKQRIRDDEAAWAAAEALPTQAQPAEAVAPVEVR
jgi:hypothetical protein